MRLISNDPLQTPLIDPGLLNEEYDLLVLREAVKSARAYIAEPVWKDYVLDPHGSVSGATTDAELDASIRETALAFTHPVGGAIMSAKDANYGVVNPDLRVKGIDGLRIVDASVLVCYFTFSDVKGVLIFSLSHYYSHVFQVLIHKQQFMSSQKELRTSLKQHTTNLSLNDRLKTSSSLRPHRGFRLFRGLATHIITHCISSHCVSSVSLGP